MLGLAHLKCMVLLNIQLFNIPDDQTEVAKHDDSHIYYSINMHANIFYKNIFATSIFIETLIELFSTNKIGRFTATSVVYKTVFPMNFPLNFPMRVPMNFPMRVPMNFQ